MNWKAFAPALLAATILSSLVAPAQAAGVILRRDLPNGAVLLAKERPTAGVIALNATIRTGYRDELPGQEGSLALLSRSLLLGTNRWPTEDELRRAIANTGGSIGTAFDSETLRVSVAVPSGELDLAVAVLSDILAASRMDSDPLERSRRQLLQEIDRRTTDPNSIAIDTIQVKALQGHPAARPSSGYANVVRGLTRADLIALRDRVIVGRNLTIAVVGQVSAATVFDQLAATLGGLPVGDRIERPAITPAAPAVNERIDRTAGQQQALAYIGVPIAGRSDPDRYALQVLVAILGGSSGRLYEEIRSQRGLAYDANSFIGLLLDAGYLVAYAGTDPENVDEVIGVIESELNAMVESPVSRQELDKAIGSLSGQRILADETSNAEAQRIAILSSLGVYETVEQFQAGVRNVTVADVQRVARRYFGAGHYIVVVKPAA